MNEYPLCLHIYPFQCQDGDKPAGNVCAMCFFNLSIIQKQEKIENTIIKLFKISTDSAFILAYNKVKTNILLHIN